MASNMGNGLSPDEMRIDDPEQLSQKKRINQILSRREAVIDARNEAVEAYLAGELTEVQALKLYQSRVEGLIVDIWTKFKNADGDMEGRGYDLLYNDSIAEVTIHPPAELLPNDKGDLAAAAEMPEPKTKTIYGLKWFIENDPIVTAQFSVSSWNPPGTRTGTGQALLDFGIIDEALLKIMEFIDEAGIDADMEEEENQTKITRELMEEFEEWRKENVD